MSRTKIDPASVTAEALAERLQSFVGREVGAPIQCLDAVNEPMIRHWCEAVGDANLAYLDASFAAGSVHGGIVAPPTMLMAWTMRGLRPPPPAAENAQSELIAVLDEAGFTSIVATNCEQTYERYLRLGDTVTASTRIQEVSAEKRTALGPGHFFATETTYRDATGAVVGRQITRYLKFRPAAPATRRSGVRPRPRMNTDTEFFWLGAQRGELLIQRCASCGELRHPPRPMCGSCGSLEWDTHRASGRGEVYSFVVHHYPPVPGFEVPYAVALVALEEGTRLVSNLVGVAPEDVVIGMPVAVEFLEIDGELTLPVFRPRASG